MSMPESSTLGAGRGVSPFQRIWRYFSAPTYWRNMSRQWQRMKGKMARRTSYHFGPPSMILMSVSLSWFVCSEMASGLNLDASKLRSEVKGIMMRLMFQIGQRGVISREE